MADVMRWLVEHRASELVVAGVAHHPDVTEAAATLGCLPGWLADAGCPAHLTLARPELMAERAALRLVFEQGSGHQS